MDTYAKVSLSFAVEWSGKVNPLLSTVCSLPLNARRISHCGTRSAWALEYHAGDVGRVYFNGLPETRIRREPGTIHLYAPTCDYWEDSNDAALPAQETYWIFTGGEAAGLERFVDNAERFARFRDPENLVGRLMVNSATLCDSCGQDAFWMAQSLFTQAISLLSGSRGIDGFTYLISSTEPPRSFSFQVEQYLRKNLSERIVLADIARYMKASRSLLCHKFKEEAGVPPMGRLIELRIERAKSLLLKGEKLKSIAELTAHSSEYHLSRNFKTVTGVSPREFRKRQMGGRRNAF